MQKNVKNMENVRFFTGLIMVLCGVAFSLGFGNKHAPPVIDNNLPLIKTTIVVPSQALEEEYKFKRGNKEMSMGTIMSMVGWGVVLAVVFSILLSTLAVIFEWCDFKWGQLQTQMKERTAERIRKEVPKWSEDVVDPIGKAEDYYTAWELLRDVNRQGDQLIMDCLKCGDKILDYLDNSKKKFSLEAEYYGNVEKVRKEMKKAEEAFNENTSVNIFFLEGWCRLHIQPIKLNQIDENILKMIYAYIGKPKPYLITSVVDTAQYDYYCDSAPQKVLTYRSRTYPRKRFTGGTWFLSLIYNIHLALNSLKERSIFCMFTLANLRM